MTRKDATYLQDLAIGCIINSNVPFNTFEDYWLQRILTCTDQSKARGFTPLARGTLSRNQDRVFLEGKAAVQKELHNARTAVHISFDLWSSPNQLSMIGVIAHFIDRKYHYQTRLLALKDHRTSHSGENMSIAIAKVVKAWGITDKIGVAMCDNASNNDSCLNSLYPRLNPAFSPEDVHHRRMWCFGHILNLVARAFLSGVDRDALELDAENPEQHQDRAQALAQWRSKGPVGKLQNIVKFVRGSTQRTTAFKKAAREDAVARGNYSLSLESEVECQLKQDNVTRWNSTCLMIERAWEKHTHIQAYLSALDLQGTASAGLPTSYFLDVHDWRVLGEIWNALEPIYNITMWSQYRNRPDGRGQLCSIQIGMDFILGHLEQPKGLYQTTEDDLDLEAEPRPEPVQVPPQQSGRLRQLNGEALPINLSEAQATSRVTSMQSDEKKRMRYAVNNARLKLDQYYSLLSQSPLHAAFVILHPDQGLQYLEKVWSGRRWWISDAIREFEAYFERWYPRADCAETSLAPVPPPRQEEDTRLHTSGFGDSFASQALNYPHEEEGELVRYYRIKPQPVSNPVKWWAERTTEFPRLSQMALDLLAIQLIAKEYLVSPSL